MRFPLKAMTENDYWGFDVTRSNSKKWLNLGVDAPLEKAKPGDIVIFWRESPESWKGHVTLFLERNKN